MAKQADNEFGKSIVTPKGVVFFLDVDSENTKEKHPQNQWPSDKFDITIGFPRTTDLSELQDEVNKVAEKAHGTIDVDMPFTDGKEKSMDSMKDYIIIRAKCAKRPGLINENKERILENEFEAGMWGKAHVTPMSYISGRNKGVTLIFKNAQLFTTDEYTSLGGGEQDATQVF